METIHLGTDLDAPVDAVWDAMQRPDTFLYLVRGLFSMPKLAGRTEPFVAGESGTGWLCALHAIPVYRHSISVEVVDPVTHTIRTREHGGVLRVWNHTLHVEPLTDGRSRYTDTVEIDAGRLTPVMAHGATQIFRYRQSRWHRLVRERLMSTDQPS